MDTKRSFFEYYTIWNVLSAKELFNFYQTELKSKMTDLESKIDIDGTILKVTLKKKSLYAKWIFMHTYVMILSSFFPSPVDQIYQWLVSHRHVRKTVQILMYALTNDALNINLAKLYSYSLSILPNYLFWILFNTNAERCGYAIKMLNN